MIRSYKEDEVIKIYERKEDMLFEKTYNNHLAYVAEFLLITTGLRIGECRALRWSDIDFGNHYIYIHRSLHKEYGEEYITSCTKTGVERYILMSQELEDMLYSLFIESGCTDLDTPVFLTIDGILSVDAIYKVLEDTTGLTGSRITRTTVSNETVLSDNRHGVQKAQKICGHTHANTTRKYYTDFSERDFDKIVDKVADFIDNEEETA